MKIAIVPGSFDPMTVGHVDVIERAAKIFDRVIVAVMINDEKTYRFSSEERTAIAAASCEHILNADVMFDCGMLTDLAERVGACAIVKGIRNQEDLAYEQKMERYNKERSPAIETVYLSCDPRFSEISSTAVRKRLDENLPVEQLVSPNALSKMIKA